MDAKSGSKPRNRYVYALIATVSPHDQLLIAQSLRKHMPAIQLVTTDTLEQTREYLQASWLEYYNFPRLLILDLELADRPTVWKFLQQLRATYPLLTIVVTGLDRQTETAVRAYSLCINVYTVKSQERTEWEEQLDILAHYWLKVATLPEFPPL